MHRHDAGAKDRGVPPPRRSRKTVTVLFTDLVGSTSLGEARDPDTYASIVSRFYEVTAGVIERHDGTVTKRLGDAVMATFGHPRLHEDDALRAVRAAVALRRALDRLNDELLRRWDVRLEHRTALHTGEVVTWSDAPDAEPLGDAITMARQLQEHAVAGGIVLSDATYQLVRDRVSAEAISGLVVAGRAQPLTAWRLLALGPPARSPTRAPVIGRDTELTILRLLYNRTLSERRGHAVTIRGGIGVGKSRLLEEFIARLGDQPRVLRGRCPAYGDDTTYGPIGQMLRKAAGIRDGDPPARQRALLARLTGEDPRATARIAAMLGLGGTAAEPSDTVRAVGAVLEQLAGQRPLILAIDDLHLARPPLVDFLIYAADLLRDVRVLLLLGVRSELFEQRGSWSWFGRLPNAHTIELSPLTTSQTEQLVGRLLPGGQLDDRVVAEVVEATGGYPLLVEEMVQTIVEQRALRLDRDRWVAATDLADLGVPSRVQSILAARLDRLQPVEQVVIQRAAVVGSEFREDEVVAVTSEYDKRTVVSALRSLVRKDLLGADGRRRRPAGTLRFRHSQIRDTAYGAMAKTERASLHELCAERLERSGSPRSEVRNRIGTHLERAYRDRLELGRNDRRVLALAERAGCHLAAAGHQTVTGSNFPQDAIPGLRRALELLPRGGDAWLTASLDLIEALRFRDLREAERQYPEVIDAARRAGNLRVEWYARLGRLEVRWFHNLHDDWEAARSEVEEAARVFEDGGDHLGLAKAGQLRAYLHAAIGQSTAALAAAEEAVELARTAGDQRLEASIRRLRGVIMHWGPTSLDTVVSTSEEDVAWARDKGLYGLEAGALSVLARCRAMQGDIAAARELNREARAVIRDLGELLTAATDSISEGVVELLAGEAEVAARALRRGYDALQRRGGSTSLANVAMLLARALIRQGRVQEAEHFIVVARGAAAASQIDTQVKWREQLALVLAHRGDLERAQHLVEEAVSLSQRSEQPDTQAEALTSKAEVLERAGAWEEAVTTLDEALPLHERKGNLVAARRLRGRREQLVRDARRR